MAIGTAVAAAPTKPHILELEYYEDLEDGPRYNVATTIRGDAVLVKAIYDGDKTDGRLSGHISEGGRSSTWFFRERAFVKQLRADLNADGYAEVTVRAAGKTAIVDKLCTLTLQPDPVYGDYASGDCKRL